MIKTILTAAAATLMIAPIATAQANDEVKVVVEYSAANVQSNAGIATLVASVETQAREACTVQITGSYLTRVDAVCVQDLVDQALTSLAAKHVEAVDTDANRFARLINENQSSFR